MKITLITCTYNASQVVQRTLDSILMQTYRDVEHIIVDGNSVDGTLDIVNKYKSRSDAMNNGHYVTIFSEPDKGLYDAMNKGIGYATGDFICFMNAGDRLYSDDTLECIVNRVRGEGKTTDNISVIYGETDVVDDDGNFLRHRRLQAPDVLTWQSFREGMLVCHQAFYANASIAKITPYNLRYRISGDVDWCIRIMKEGEHRGMTTFNVRNTLCKYLAGGMSVKNHRASLMERWHTMVDHYGLFSTVCQHLWFVLRTLLKR